MIPTLLGRWQTRLLLLGTIGVLVTLVFSFMVNNFVTPFVLLGYVLLLGFIWDIFYDFLQSLRWDRDWPPIFFVGSGLIEALLLGGLVKVNSRLWHTFGVISFPGIDPELTLIQFAAHYGTIWLVTFLFMLGPLKVLYLRWRFNGGELF